MPFCPKCGAEYREGFKYCVDCKEPLKAGANPVAVEVKKEEKEKRSDEKKYRKLLEAGDKAYDEEKYEEALELLNEASQIESQDPEVWNLLGLTYQALGHNREAWRSFKFALQADPNDLNTLWYAAHFLYEVEDYELALNMIERYIQLEDDPQERKEAESLRDDIRYALKEREDFVPAVSTDEDEEEIEEEVPSDEFTVLNELEDEEEVEDEDESWDIEEVEVMDEDEFLADLTLQLTDRNSKCLYCGVSLPTDAPYCFNCKKPHLYEPLKE